MSSSNKLKSLILFPVPTFSISIVNDRNAVVPESNQSYAMKYSKAKSEYKAKVLQNEQLRAHTFFFTLLSPTKSNICGTMHVTFIS